MASTHTKCCCSPPSCWLRFRVCPKDTDCPDATSNYYQQGPFDQSLDLGVREFYIKCGTPGCDCGWFRGFNPIVPPFTEFPTPGEVYRFHVFGGFSNAGLCATFIEQVDELPDWSLPIPPEAVISQPDGGSGGDSQLGVYCTNLDPSYQGKTQYCIYESVEWFSLIENIGNDCDDCCEPVGACCFFNLQRQATECIEATEVRCNQLAQSQFTPNATCHDVRCEGDKEYGWPLTPCPCEYPPGSEPPNLWYISPTGDPYVCHPDEVLNRTVIYTTEVGNGECYTFDAPAVVPENAQVITGYLICYDDCTGTLCPPTGANCSQCTECYCENSTVTVMWPGIPPPGIDNPDIFTACCDGCGWDAANIPINVNLITCNSLDNQSDSTACGIGIGLDPRIQVSLSCVLGGDPNFLPDCAWPEHRWYISIEIQDCDGETSRVGYVKDSGTSCPEGTYTRCDTWTSTQGCNEPQYPNEINVV